MADLQNAVRDHRRARDLSQRALAEAAGIARQTLSAIEAGRLTPSTAVSLALARALGVSVEALFWLDDPASLTAEVEGAAPAPGTRVRLGRIDGRWVAHPLRADDATGLAVAADALVEGPAGADADADADPAAPATSAPRARVRVRPLTRRDHLDATLVVAGCDPALGLLVGRLADRHPGARLTWIDAGSLDALAALAAGRAHLAGVHLVDDATGEQNLPFARRALAGRPARLVTLGRWRQGLVVAPGNPLGVHGVADLARPGLRLVDREAGAGAHRLLRRRLAAAGVPAPAPALLARGHQAVAQAVTLGAGDVGVATECVAAAFGLAFLPLSEERFDLVVPGALAADPRLAPVLDTLASATFHRELGGLPGYDAREAGAEAAHL